MNAVKLIATALAGYALYELGQLLWSGIAPGASEEAQPPKRPARPRSSKPAKRITGPGRGMRVEVADSGGTAHAQVAGRGVVRR